MPSGSMRRSSRDKLRAMLFVGALYGGEDHYRRALQCLADAFGPVLAESPPMPWEYSDYYQPELGRTITRRFVFFENLISQDELRDIKLRTVEMEAKLSTAGKRSVNLDPGYLTPAKVVLASTKDYSHRVCLGGGIFAEVTLYFQGGAFRPHLFTYRDYREEATLRMFAEMRSVLKNRL